MRNSSLSRPCDPMPSPLRRWGRCSALTALALAALGASALASACGNGKSDDDDGSSASGTGGTPFDLDSGLGTGAYEGGKVELTPEQAAALLDGATACTGWNAEPEGGPSTLMLVVDTSQSMDSPPEGSNRSKWSITQEALVGALEALPASAWVGLMFYPNAGIYNGGPSEDITACVDVSSLVPVSALGGATSDQRQALISAIEQAVPGGCTPTHGAYVWGLEHGLRAIADAPGNRYMALITDGQPTLALDCSTGPAGGGCSPANPTDKVAIQDEIAAALADDGTRTWIIGSPGSEANETTGEDVRDWLSIAAERGGTAAAGCSHTGEPYCHFDMSVEPDFSAGLQRALASIAGEIIGCEYSIPPPPSASETVNRDEVNLVITDSSGQSSLILRDADPDCDEGWYYEGDQVMLCAQTCADVENDPGASLNLTFGCTSNEIPEIF